MSSIIVPIILGAVIVALGVTNIMGNISTIHLYHRHRVMPENIKPFGRLVGTGTVVIGAGIILFGALSFVTRQTGSYSFTAVGAVLVIVGIVIGLPIMLYAMFKYNKGIF